jgi:hypothetical protein
MRRALGQAARGTGRLVHALFQLALALLIGGAVAGGLLAWRLAQGPIELPWLAQRLQDTINADGGPTRLVIGGGALAWNGFTRGADHPVEIVLTGIAAIDQSGQRIAQLPRAELTLSAAGLLTGRLVPRTLELDGVRLRALRAADGGLTIDLGSIGEDVLESPAPDAAAAAEAAGTADAAAPATPAAEMLASLLHELSRPAATDLGSQPATPASRFSQLRRIQVRDAALVVNDRQIGTTWRASGIDIDLRRRPDGGTDADASMTLALGPERVHVTASAAVQAMPAATTLPIPVPVPVPVQAPMQVQVRFSPVTPSRLAALAPGLAPLAALDAPVTLSGSADFGADLSPARFSVKAGIGAGRLYAGVGSTPLIDAAVEAEGTPSQVQITLQRLTLAPRPDGPRTVFRGTADARRNAGGAQATITAQLDQVAFADLPALWPAGVGGPGTRPWIAENITAGLARNGHVEVGLDLPADLSDVTVTALAGGLDAQDLTVHWLRPVPPIEHANGRLAFLSPDDIEITVTGGRQTTGTQGSLAIPGGSVRIAGIAGRDQFLTVEADLAGPVVDLLTVLKHKRLHLFDKRPLDLRDVAGTVIGRVAVNRLPLENDMSLDDLHIQANGKLSRLHIADIVSGHDLDQGALDFEASTEALRLRGTAQLAGIPARLQVDMDFRSGPPTAVLQKVVVSGTAEATQLTAAGLDTGGMIDGPAALQATLQSRRNGRGDIAVRADLARAALLVPRLNFRKPPGRPAAAELRLLLEHDQITAIDRIRVDGDGLAFAGRLSFAGGRPQTLQIDRVRLGPNTEAAGDLRFPQLPTDTYVARLTGRSLDVSAEFSHAAPTDKPPPAEDNKPGQPWRVEARFEQVVLGDGGRLMRGVSANGVSDGRKIIQGRIDGRTGTDSNFRIEIVPRQGVRTLSGNADDAGELLRVLNLVDTMQGGRMTLSGSYNDARLGLPLTGTAEISDFRMHNVPGLGKVLQAMTLYGLVDALRGPGLGFSRLVAPFRLTGDLLELTEARAFSASLGMTAKGRIDIARSTVAIDGTIVPAYFFNSLLGNIPLIGRLFSPERGGGLFAATYSINGAFADPSVAVNPLAALTPGFLRGVFGIFDGPQGGTAPAPPPTGQGRGAQN